STTRRTAIVKDETTGATVRVFPQPNCRNGDLARSISDLAQKEGWKLEELHTEEGRLDEVFRSITLPETVQQEQK
ncbi:MAG: ABC transporter ATP-binding protein, partial [Verrucomicrobiota bacterium]